MKKNNVKKMIIGGISFFLLLLLVLAAHIYIVTRPGIDATTRVMARIDVKQDINQDEANKITAWLYAQHGIDHVMINPVSDIVIFTFFPIKTNANDIVRNFKSTFNYHKAERFVPSEAQLKSSCPVAGNSLTHRIYSFFK